MGCANEIIICTAGFFCFVFTAVKNKTKKAQSLLLVSNRERCLF